MGCLKRIGITLIVLLIFEQINQVIIRLFGPGVGALSLAIAVAAGMLYVLFGSLFDDNNPPPDDLSRRMGEAAWQNQINGKYK